MKVVSSAFIAEKNKIASNTVTCFLLEIQLIGGDTLRFTDDNQDVLWNSQTWLSFPFKIETIGENGKGEIPSVSVKVADATGQIVRALEELDGANGSPVIIRVVNLSVSGSTEAEVELPFKLKKSTWSDTEINFVLEGGNCLTRRVPPSRYLPDFCRFEYGSIRCGVSAATQASYPTCNRTRAECTERGNSTRFGGFPNMPKL